MSWFTRRLNLLFGNGGLPFAEFHENISISAGSEVATAHSLGSVPSMIIITARKDGIFEDGDTSNTSTNFYIKNIGVVDGVVSCLVVP